MFILLFVWWLFVVVDDGMHVHVMDDIMLQIDIYHQGKKIIQWPFCQSTKKNIPTSILFPNMDTKQQENIFCIKIDDCHTKEAIFGYKIHDIFLMKWMFFFGWLNRLNPKTKTTDIEWNIQKSKYRIPLFD